MEIKIRKAKLSDLKQTAKLSRMLMVYEFSIWKIYNSLSEKQLFKYQKKKIKSKNSLLVVAEDNKKIIGYALAEIEKKKIWEKTQMAYYHDAFVLPKYRRMGITKKMSAMIFNWLKKRKIKYFKNSVLVGNEPAVKTWASLGFKPYETFLIKKL